VWSPIAQRQSTRLLIEGLLVRIQLGEQQEQVRNSAFLTCFLVWRCVVARQAGQLSVSSSQAASASTYPRNRVPLGWKVRAETPSPVVSRVISCRAVWTAPSSRATDVVRPGHRHRRRRVHGSGETGDSRERDARAAQ